MKKTLLIIAAILLAVFNCQAHHVIGGEMTYQYLGKGSASNTSRYLITLKIFRDQNAINAAPMPLQVYIGIFNKDGGPAIFNVISKKSELAVPVGSLPPCIQNAPNLNYHVGIFELTVDLPDNQKGYTAGYQTCCRVDNLANVQNFGGNETGSTFTTEIPPAQYKDNSPEFVTKVDVVCANKPFELDYSATDKDNDSLVYSFTNAYDGGSIRGDSLIPPEAPPYNSVIYINSYSSLLPLGPKASINSKTGIVSGIAPPVGKYVLGVKVSSYRNGVLLNEHLKDFIINVSNCDFSGAQLDPKPVLCDSFNVAFQNSNTSSLNHTFYWDFGDPKSGTNNTSTLQTPTHVFTDTGVFIYKLIINRGEDCSDSTTQTLKLYPGFYPAFNVDGQCINSSILFTDKTTTNYGSVNSWSWNFGDPTVFSDTSKAKNPSYIYLQPGNYDVQLTVGNSKGCSKSFTKTVPIKTQPDFSVNNDTLICSIDTLQLTAIGNGSISWTPAYNINNQNSFTPLVSPKVPTTYYATLNESRGCIGTDSVFVNVVNNVSLSLTPDTTVCLTDTVRLNPISDGLHYVWTPSNTILNDTAKYALVVPLQNTTYHVVSSIGKCNAAANISVKPVPYPQANAGNDTTVCFPATVQLHGSGGSIYNWSPPIFLNNSQIADPVSKPLQSVSYLLQVNDVLGCPKPSYAVINITVEKPVADAGPADTAIVVNQPLQLNGTGAQFYLWTPSTGLNNPDISNPVAILTESQKYTLQVKTLAGCTAEDTIHVNVYKVLPDLYVPDAFTPNGDGINDVFRPIPIGIKKLNYFKVYNRLGQLVYSTTLQKAGWDGTFKGQPQDPGVFVWIAEAVDYLGKTVFRKGSVTLIR
ncbi:MAG: gliding motility-associated C-terminal domain-containing protein [Bacteroidota bacterium]|nr:gliding motility-associated C-terminal domain-containing protein [Bacteroidota bacterium]